MEQSIPSVLQAKVVVLGNSSVGKTSVILRICEDKFSSRGVTTIGVDFKIKEMEVEGKKVKLKIWDTAGQERYRNIAESYFKGANGVFLIYACDNKSSFEDIGKWMSTIDSKVGPDVVRILVGNKKDTHTREVSYEEGKKLADSYGIKFIETSAKENENITELFTMMGKLMFKDALLAANRKTFRLTERPKKTPDRDASSCC